MKARKIIPALLAILVAAGLWWFDIRTASEASRSPSAAGSFERDGESVSGTDSVSEIGVASDSSDSLTIDELLTQSRQLFDRMSEQLEDYTATFVKRELDTSGNLGEESSIAMKVQTRFRGGQKNAGKRVYLKFESPSSVAGREVLWGEDLYDGQMAVHETGFLLNLKTIWLDPNGMIAMNGQRYPISEIGMVRLAEKLIERGESLRSEAGLSVRLERSIDFDGVKADRYRIYRDAPLEPQENADDFSVAEIVMDLNRSLILQYQSFGWPAEPDMAPPLLESYRYRNVKTNVGLGDADFDVKNPAYQFP